MTLAEELTARHLPGWRVSAEIANETTGVLCEVYRFGTEPSRRGVEWRKVWLDDGGAVDADIDGRGYIVTTDGRRL